MLSILSSVLGSIFSGGATGLIGAGLQRFFDYKNKQQDLLREKQQQEFQLTMKDKDAAIMAQEWAGRLKVADREGQTAEAVAESSAFAGTLFKEPERYSNVATLTPGQNWVMILLDFARGVIRPALTVYLCALTSYVWWEVHGKLDLEDLETDQALQIWMLVVETILYLTTTVVLWWFGTRNKQPTPQLKLK